MHYHKNNFILLLLLLCVYNANSTELLSRQKRLIWPSGTAKIQLIIGFGIPVDLQRETIILGLLFKANYLVPQNLTELHYGGVIYERKKRSLSRWDIYKMLAQESEMRGQGGKSCVLRSICEAADMPFNRYDGFFNELFHSTFTPTSTTEELSHHTDNEYFGAQKLGMGSRGKCGQFFPECKRTFLDVFTERYF